VFRTGATRTLVLVFVLAALLAPSFAAASSKRATEIRQIKHYRQTTWHWQSVIGVSRTPTSYGEKRIASSAYRRWVLRLWRHRTGHIQRRVVRVPHKAQWLCIHRGEGSWTANTGNSYYGGLQMDLAFQRTYGRYLLKLKGTANHWTPHEQMWVAERARRSGRGFHPWPNTARACGLI
jgi:hypothetical protein